MQPYWKIVHIFQNISYYSSVKKEICMRLEQREDRIVICEWTIALRPSQSTWRESLIQRKKGER